jgi:hypothetical protein
MNLIKLIILPLSMIWLICFLAVLLYSINYLGYFPELSRPDPTEIFESKCILYFLIFMSLSRVLILISNVIFLFEAIFKKLEFGILCYLNLFNLVFWICIAEFDLLGIFKWLND